MAPVIRLFFHLPYVVDLRDPWRLARRGTHIHGLKAHLGELLTNIAEPIVLRYSAKVICVSEYMCKEYREVYSYLPSQKFVVITNGYDPDDFATIEPIYFAEFTIVYTGKFRTAEALRDPTHFFYALKILKEHNLKVRFVHIGMKEEEVLNIAKQIKILELIEVIGPCPYKKTLSYAKGSNLLLLIAGGQKTEQTGKIFDYIGCSRPILALASPNGEIAKIVKKIYNARLIKNNDPEAIAMIIKEMLYENQKVVQTKIVQRKYYRRNLTNKLSSVFEEVYVRTGRIIKQ
jgi:glycosyltransferase involved in cell wall biosynthesis